MEESKSNNLKLVLPLDHLDKIWPEELKGTSVGAVIHPASVNSNLEFTRDVLLKFSSSHHSENPLFDLKCLFGPQHGILGQTQDNMIEWNGFHNNEHNIDVYSLYGQFRKPTPEMLKDIDTLVVDLQDVGTRYYTFVWTMLLVMEASSENDKKIVVCDRPNPLTDTIEESSKWEQEYSSFIGLYQLHIRHGLTIGQIAQKLKNEKYPHSQLYVLDMQNYNPKLWWDQLHLQWVPPSPNMPTLDTAIVYPGMCLFEATNVSEGRGTTTTFQIFGAPWIQAKQLCAEFNSREENKNVVYLREAHFEPTFHKYKEELCHGAFIHVLDRNSFKSFEFGISLLKFIYQNYKEFKWNDPPYEYEYKLMPIDILLGNGWYRN